LDVSDKSLSLVEKRHEEALDPEHERGLLTGTVLVLDNPSPVNSPDTPDRTVFYIGGSTLQEAATEVIGAFDSHANEMPDWVGSTNEELSKIISEHFCYGDHVCTSFPMSKVPS